MNRKLGDLGRIAASQDRLAAQFGTVTLFSRREERVHIYVENVTFA